MMNSPEPIYLDEIHEDIATFAERHLEEEERADFVDQLLERHGYQRQSTWAPPPPPDPSQGGGGGRRLVPPAKRSSAASKKSSYFKRA